MLNIKALIVGDLQTNCYLVSSEVSPGMVAQANGLSAVPIPNRSRRDSSQVKPKEECLIIDPGDEADFITQFILEQKLKPSAIILTHGHFDHVLGCLELKLNFDIPILLHQKDQKIYNSANQSATHWLKKKSLKVPPIDRFIKEGDEIKVGNKKLKVIETPGHTPGSVCLYHEVSPGTVAGTPDSSQVKPEMPALFTGDTLFTDGVGRTDFSYSKPIQLTKSLDRIKKLPENTIIYPGHGESAILFQWKKQKL